MSRSPRDGGADGAPAFGHFDFLNWITDSGILADLKPLEVKVLWVYLRHANGQTGEAWPSIERIAGMVCRVPDRTRVRKAVHELHRHGILYLVSEGGGAGRSTVYRLATGAEFASVSIGKKGGDPRGKTGAVCAENRGEIRVKREANFAPRTTNRTTQVTSKGTGTACGGAPERLGEDGRDGDVMNGPAIAPTAPAADPSPRDLEAAYESKRALLEAFFNDEYRKKYGVGWLNMDTARPHLKSIMLALGCDGRLVRPTIRRFLADDFIGIRRQRHNPKYLANHLNEFAVDMADAAPDPNDIGAMTAIPDHILDELFPPAHMREQVDQTTHAAA